MTHAADIQGQWQMIRAEFDGESAPELVVAKTLLELAGNKYAMRFDGEVMDAGTFLSDTGPTGAKTLVLSGDCGTNAGRTIPAIFQCTGDRLRICFGFAGIPPVRFATATGSHLYLATYRRIAR